jgi:hypothetical protein
LSRVLRLLNRLLQEVRTRWVGLGRRWQLVLLGAAVVAFSGVSVASYRAYSYVEHDNDFCTTCHLMQDAYARFQRSAHSDISCKACHKATPGERLTMLTAAVVEDPTDVRVHAHVPNARCEACHVQGDSTRWRQIAATAGHRIHLESRDTTLRDLECVTCHSANLHEFASVDQTCGRAGCHVQQARIRLGAMAQVEIHCTTCHNFMADVRGLAVDSLGRPLTPHARQCLGCHQMRERMAELDIGRDPHRGVCGDCHNPHEQTTARAITCASASCHVGWEQVSFHVGVPHPDRCTRCHEPHSWRVEGENCIRCHQSILDEWRRGRVIGAGPPPPAAPRSALRHGTADERRPIAQLAMAASDAVPLPLAQTPAPRPRPAPAAPQPAPRGPGFPRFSHGQHREQRCAECHSSRVRHGALVVTSEAQCQACHHQRPGREDCVFCHQARDLRRAVAADRTLHLAGVGRTVTRRVRFEHTRHTTVECTRCHTSGLTRRPEPNCSTCHVPHHSAEADCAECHAGSDALRTHRAQDHTTCTSAGCHDGRPANVPATRAMCLVCHTDKRDHVPGRNCENCHRVMTGARR